VANAREAAVECSRRRVERAEVAQAVAELTAADTRPPPDRPRHRVDTTWGRARTLGSLRA